jgi:interferon gamma-inducible protein 30
MLNKIVQLTVFAVLTVMVMAATLEVDIGVQPKDDRVTIELYYETLCPYSHMFVTGQLKSVLAQPVTQSLNQGIWDIADFKLYPYGNANLVKNGKNYTFTCQHGPQ